MERTAGQRHHRHALNEHRTTGATRCPTPQTPKTVERLLAVYLRDHFAGAAAGLAPAERCQRANDDNPLGAVMGEIARPALDVAALDELIARADRLQAEHERAARTAFDPEVAAPRATPGWRWRVIPDWGYCERAKRVDKRLDRDYRLVRAANRWRGDPLQLPGTHRFVPDVAAMRLAVVNDDTLRTRQRLAAVEAGRKFGGITRNRPLRSQRVGIGESVLGLLREPSLNTTKPFSEDLRSRRAGAARSADPSHG